MPIQEFSLPFAPEPAAPCQNGSPTKAGVRLLRQAARQAERGHLEEALTILDRAMQAGADPYACYLQMVFLYRAMEQWQTALEAAEKVLALAPRDISAYERVMALALEVGDCERAITVSLALLKIAPRHVSAHDTLGAAYIQMGNVEAAMRVTNALIRLDPQTAAHHFKKALLCQHKGEVPLAVQEFTEALLLAPKGPHAEAAREALETLDAYQLNQIVTLAMEDTVFRVKLSRNPLDAASERGFYLSETGCRMLEELSRVVLPDIPEPCRPIRYN